MHQSRKQLLKTLLLNLSNLPIRKTALSRLINCIPCFQIVNRLSKSFFYGSHLPHTQETVIGLILHTSANLNLTKYSTCSMLKWRKLQSHHSYSIGFQVKIFYRKITIIYSSINTKFSSTLIQNFKFTFLKSV